MGNVYNYDFRPECMEALGVTNQVDLFSAIDHANDSKTIAYVVASHGGAEKASDTIHTEAQKHNEGLSNYISPRQTEYLIDSGIQASTIKHAIAEEDLPEFNYHVDSHNRETGISPQKGMQGFIQKAKAKMLS